MHMFAENYAKGDGVDVGSGGVRRTCIHVPVHAHILTKMWEQKRDHWEMHEGPWRGYMFAHSYAKEGGAEVRSQVDMHTHVLVHVHILTNVWDQRTTQE